MKNNSYLLLLFFPCFALAQARHDLKVDLFQGFLRTANFSYEATPSKNFGVELGFGYEWGKIGFFTGASPIEGDYRSYSQNVGHVSIMGKHYPSKRANGDRWFYGGYFNQKFEINQDPDYAIEYENLFGREPQNKQNLWSGLGATAGFKKVYQSRLIIELGFSTEFNVAALLASKDERTFDFGGSIQVKVGYRISAPKGEKSLDK
ncbi:MAG: hypothetical protein KA138_15650 [Saprospiraceae bacterium]|nr:hypothetical protein [Saprospiraceae bacterium]